MLTSYRKVQYFFIALMAILSMIGLQLIQPNSFVAEAEASATTSFLSKYNGINSVVGNIVKWNVYDKYFACISDGYGIKPTAEKSTLINVTKDGIVDDTVSGMPLISSPGGQGYVFPNGVTYGNGNAGKRFAYFAVPNNNDLSHASFIEATNNTAQVKEEYQDIYNETGFLSGGSYLSLRNAEDWKKIIHAASKYSQAGIYDNEELGTKAFKGGIINTSDGLYNYGNPVRPEQEEGWGTLEDVQRSSTSIEGKLTHNGNNNTGTPGFGQRLNNAVPNYNYIAVKLEEDWTATKVTGQTMLPVASTSASQGYNDRDISFGTSFEGDVNNYETGLGDTKETVGYEQIYFMPSDSPFSFGRLAIPDFTYIILDLNGHKLDRALTGENETSITSQVFSIGRYARLEVFDSSANEGNPHGDGVITGGNTGNGSEGLYNSNKGGAFWVGQRGELVLHSGTITGNSSTMGGCVYAPLNGTINIFDPYITGNIAQRGGVAYGANGSFTVTNVFGGVFEGNAAVFNNFLAEVTSNTTYNGTTASEKDGRYSYGWGGTFTASINSFLNFYGGEIVNNYSSAYGGGVFVTTSSFVKMYGGVVKDNLSNFMGYSPGGYSGNVASTKQFEDIINGGGGIFLSQDAGGVYINGPAEIYNNYNLSTAIDASLLDFSKMKAGVGCDRINQAKNIKNAVQEVLAEKVSVSSTGVVLGDDSLASSNLYLGDITVGGSDPNMNNDGVHTYPEIKVQGYLSNEKGNSARVFVTPAKGDEGGYIMRSFKEEGWPDDKNQINVKGEYTFNNTEFLGDNVYGEYFYTDSGTSLYQEDGWIYIRNIEDKTQVPLTWQYLSAPGVWTNIGAQTSRVSVTYNGTNQIDNIRAIFQSTHYEDTTWYLYATKYEVYDNAGQYRNLTYTLKEDEKIFDVINAADRAVKETRNVGSFEFTPDVSSIANLQVDGMISPSIDIGLSEVFSPPSKTFKIDKANLKVKAKDATITYGEAAPKYEVEFTSLLGDDLKAEADFISKLNISCDYTQGNDATTYQITVSGNTFTNYNLTFENGTLTVNKRKIELEESSVTVDDKTYDGNDLATVHMESATFKNIYGGDSLTLTADSSKFEDKNAGQNKTVNISGLHIDGEKASNYELTTTSLTKQATINKKEVTALIESKKVEYLAQDAELTYDLQDDLASGDTEQDLGITLTRDEGKTVGKYTIHGQFKSQNYNVTFEGGTDAYEIYKKAISVPVVRNKTYNSELQTADVDELEGKGQIFDVSKNEGGTNAGTYEVEFTLTDTNYRWQDDEDGNNLKATTNFKILQAQLNVSWSNLSVDYNGGEQRPSYDANFAKNDTKKAYLLFDSVRATGKTDAGTYQVTLTLPENLMDNYTLDSAILTQQFIIKALAVTVSWQNTEFEYSGDVIVPVPEIGGVLELDQRKAELLYQYVSGNTFVNANATKDGDLFGSAYTVVIELNSLIKNNYKIEDGQQQTTFLIKQAPLTVKWATNDSDKTNESDSKRYVRWTDAQANSADYVYNRLTVKRAYSQDNNILIATLQGTKKSEVAPQFNINFEGGDSISAGTVTKAKVVLVNVQGNYYIEDSGNLFTTNTVARQVTVKILDKEGVYGGNQNTAHAEGLKDGVELSSTSDDWSYEEESLHFLESEDDNIKFLLKDSESSGGENYLKPGNYEIVGSFSGDNNYTVKFVGTNGETGRFAISEATIKKSGDWKLEFDYAGGDFGEHIVGIKANQIGLAGDVAFGQANITYKNPTKNGVPFAELVDETDYKIVDGAYVIWHVGTYVFDVEVTAPYHKSFTEKLSITISQEHVYVTLDTQKIQELEYGSLPTAEEELNLRLKELFFNKEVIKAIEGFTGDIDDLAELIEHLRGEIEISLLGAENSTSGNLKVGTYSLNIEADQIFLGDATISFKDDSGDSMLKITQKQVSVQFGVVSQFEYKGDFRISPSITKEDILSNDKVDISFRLNKSGQQVSNFDGSVGQYQIVLTALTNLDAANYKLPEKKEFDFEIIKKQVTVILQDQTETYDGKTKEIKQGEDYWQLQEGSNFVDGEEVNIIIYCDEELINAGVYTLKARTDDSNYDITSVGQNKDEGQFIINKRKLSKPVIQSKTYNGQNQVADIDQNLYTIQENYGGVDVGEYVVKVKIKDFANNSWDFSDSDEEVTLNFSITKATLQIQWSDTTLQYNGQKQKPKVTAAFVGKDVEAYTVKVSDLTSENEDEEGKRDVGEYLATISLDKLLDNYTLQEGSEITQHFNITAITITITNITAEDKEYDGNTTATLKYDSVVYSGKLELDELSVTAKGTFEDKNVGTKQVDITELVLGGNDAKNYILETKSLTASAQIYARSITVSGIEAQDKVYDGNTTATLVYDAIEFTDKLEDDTLSVTAVGTFEDKNVGTKRVDITKITLVGEAAQNYHLSTETLTATAKINKLNIKLQGLQITKSKTYDGTDRITTNLLEEMSLDGVIQPDIVSLKTLTARYQTTDVGENIKVLFTFELDGADANNYSLEIDEQTAEITQAKLVIKANSLTIHYGDNIPEFTVEYEGFVNQENEKNLIGELQISCEYAVGKDATDYDITPGGFTSSNYAIEYKNAVLHVEKKDITVQIEKKSSEYNKAEVPLTFTFDESDLVGDDTREDLQIILVRDRAEEKKAGDYDIIGSSTSKNYKVNFEGGKNAYTISRAKMEIPTLGEKEYNGQKQVADIPEGYFAEVNEGGIEVGKYDVVLGLDEDNYEWKEDVHSEDNKAHLTFEITKKQVTVILQDQTETYDGTAKEIKQGKEYWQLQEGSNFVEGEEVNIEIYCDTEELIQVGTYTLKARTDNKNYEIIAVGQGKDAGLFVIIKRTLTKPEIESMTYNGQTQVADIDENLFTIEENAGGVDVGEYVVKIKIKDFINNAWQFSETNDEVILHFNITKATLQIQWSDTTLQYNGKKQKPIVTGNFVGRDIGAYSVTVSDLSSENADSDGKKEVGQYLATLILDKLFDNYDLQEGSEATHNFTITALSITVSGITAQDKEYDGGNSATLVYDSVTFHGKYVDDELSVTAKGFFEDVNVGPRQVNITEITLQGQDSANYILTTQTLTANANINVRTITVSGIGAKDKTYDGTQQAELVYDAFEFQGKVDEDILSVTAVGTFEDKNVGLKHVDITEITLVGEKALNYKLNTDSLTATANINKLDIKLKGMQITKSKAYDGTDSIQLNPLEQINLDGIVEQDSVSLKYIEAKYKTKDVAKNIEILFTFELDGEDAGNYNLVIDKLTGEITQADLKIKAQDVTVNYGDDKPEFVIDYDGFVNEENKSNLNGELQILCDYKVGSDVDDYFIIVSGYSSSNYKIKYEEAKLHVLQKPITVQLEKKESVYNQKEETLTFTFDERDLVGDDTEADLNIVLTRDRPQEKNAGDYDIIGSSTSKNYKVNFEGGTNAYTIKRAQVEIPTIASKSYNGKNQVADIPEGYIAETNEGGIEVGEYDVVLVLDDLNYEWKDENHSEDNKVHLKFEITKANNNFTLEFNLENWVYGKGIGKVTLPEAQFGTPTITIYDQEGNEYTLENLNELGPGEYTVVVAVQGTKNYSGLSKEYQFRIEEQKNFLWWIYLLVGVVVLTGLAVVFLLLAMKKRKRKRKISSK